MITKIYLHRWGNSFDTTAKSDPFPLVHEGELPSKLRLILPSKSARYIMRTSYFEFSSVLKIDNCPVYVETEEEGKQI